MSFAVPMQDILSMPWGRHALAVVGSYGIEGYKPSVEFLPVAQHRRILAQHRQQAGKLVGALRQVRGYTDSPHVVGVIDEALADWEKTK